MVDTDVNGEFGYQIILTEFLNKRAATSAAGGWGGDKYATYENKPTGDVLVAQFTTWDTPQDAQDFFNAYCERTEKRYNAKRPDEVTGKPRVYETSEGLVAIELRDKDVVIIEGAKSPDQLKLLWQQILKSKKSLM